MNDNKQWHDQVRSLAEQCGCECNPSLFAFAEALFGDIR